MSDNYPGKFGGGFKAIQWPLTAFAIILLFNLIFTRGFFEITIVEGRLVGSLIDLLKRAAPRLIIALGMTLVIATEGIDVSVGSIAAIGGSLTALVIRRGDIEYLATQSQSTVPLFIILAVAISAGAVCGLFNGLLVSVVKIQPIVATLILMVTGRGMAMLFTGGYVLTFDHHTFQALGIGDWLGFPIPILLALLFFIIIHTLMKLTPMGLLVQATGGNTTAAHYAGTNTTAIKILVYVISGICAAMAGVIFTADVQSADAAYIGLWVELDAILAVVIGGTIMSGGRFNLAGTVIGALVIQSLVTTLLTRAVPVQFTLIFQAAVVIVVLILQSPRIKEISFVNRSVKRSGTS